MSHFVSKLDSDRIVKAIAEAEKRSSAEIRVHVTRHKPANLEERAKRRFELLGMTATALRNGVLIYIAPRVRRFHVLGDSGIHEKCGDDFWKETAAEIEAHFRRGDFTEGIVRGIARISNVLATHFPRSSEDLNELPDEVTED